MAEVVRRGEVRMLPGATRPEDALKFIHEILSMDPPIKGILVVNLDSDGDVSIRVFGQLTCGDTAWAGTQLVDSALHD